MPNADIGTGTEANLRRARRRIRLRLKVLEAAQALFEEHGYDGTKVSEICARAGIAYGTFFNYFAGKADLILGLAEQAMSRLAENLEQIAKNPGTIEDQLIDLFEGDAEQMDPARRELLGLLWKATLTDAPVDYESRFHTAFEAFLTEGVARGIVRDDVPIETLAEVVGSTYSSMTLSWLHFENYPLRERAKDTARFLASTLTPTNRRPTTRKM